MRNLYWANRPFGYGEKYPMLDVGQVVELKPEADRSQRDRDMIRLGLLKEVTGNTAQCGKCGALFADDGKLSMHGRRHHEKSYAEIGRVEAATQFDRIANREAALGLERPTDREVPSLDLKTAEEVGRLRALEEADKFAEQNLPLNLDKTKASQEPGRGRRASR